MPRPRQVQFTVLVDVTPGTIATDNGITEYLAGAVATYIAGTLSGAKVTVNTVKTTAI